VWFGEASLRSAAERGAGAQAGAEGEAARETQAQQAGAIDRPAGMLGSSRYAGPRGAPAPDPG
jgi:hypothetical protein